MAQAVTNDNTLNTGSESDSSLPPSTIYTSTASIQGNVPPRLASPLNNQQSATSSPTLPISELVHDDNTGLKPPPFACLHDSKHNPDFRVRNQAKVLKFDAVVSDLQLLLQAARRAEDQPKLDSLHACILRAGKCLDGFTKSSLVAQAEDNHVSSDGSLGEIMCINRESEWYTVQHESLDGEDSGQDSLATERLKVARKAYEAKLNEASSDSESDGGVIICDEGQSQSQDTTLVEDSLEDSPEDSLEDQLLLLSTGSVIVDGSPVPDARRPIPIGNPGSFRSETLQHAADFLEALQRGNNAIMNAHGITFADLDIVEDDTSMPESVEESPPDLVELDFGSAETLEQGNEAVLAAHNLSLDDSDEVFDWD